MVSQRLKTVNQSSEIITQLDANYSEHFAFFILIVRSGLCLSSHAQEIASHQSCKSCCIA
jgi:hypothetical protein